VVEAAVSPLVEMLVAIHLRALVEEVIGLMEATFRTMVLGFSIVNVAIECDLTQLRFSTCLSWHIRVLSLPSGSIWKWKHTLATSASLLHRFKGCTSAR
jgi:hypothetical protein